MSNRATEMGLAERAAKTYMDEISRMKSALAEAREKSDCYDTLLESRDALRAERDRLEGELAEARFERDSYIAAHNECSHEYGLRALAGAKP